MSCVYYLLNAMDIRRKRGNDNPAGSSFTASSKLRRVLSVYRAFSVGASDIKRASLLQYSKGMVVGDIPSIRLVRKSAVWIITPAGVVIAVPARRDAVVDVVLDRKAASHLLACFHIHRIYREVLILSLVLPPLAPMQSRTMLKPTVP